MVPEDPACSRAWPSCRHYQYASGLVPCEVRFCCVPAQSEFSEIDRPTALALFQTALQPRTALTTVPEPAARLGCYWAACKFMLPLICNVTSTIAVRPLTRLLLQTVDVEVMPGEFIRLQHIRCTGAEADPPWQVCTDSSSSNPTSPLSIASAR